MPIVKVYGLLGNFEGNGRLAELKQLLAKVTADNVPHLSAREVTVFFPPDMDPDVGKECIIFVDGLFNNEERTPIVRGKLALGLVAALGKFLAEHALAKRLIECFVRPSDPRDGFAAGS